MKKLLLLITALFILASVEGQILRYSNYVASAEPTPDFYDEYDTVYAAFTTKPHDTIATIQEALVYSLDTAGYWDRMDLLYVFANHDSADMYINWVKPGTFNASMLTTGYTWDQYEGVTGNGTNSRITTGWTASSHAVNYTVNSASLGLYVRTNLLEGVSYILAGSYNSTNDVAIAFTYDAGPVTQWQINSATAYENSFAGTPGLFIVSRTAANACALYRNGSLIEAVADASDGVPSGPLYVLDVSDGTAQQISILYTMNGTANATEAGEINTIIETFMDALGKGIQ